MPPPKRPPRRAGASATTCSKASKATRTPSSIAARWGAGASPACRGPRAKSVLPLHPAEIGGQEHHQPERDAVPREGLEVVRPAVAGQAEEHAADDRRP